MTAPGSSTSVTIGPRREPGGATACEAPSVQLFFRPDGEVRACCRNERSLGHVATDGPLGIWAGSRRSELVDAVGRHDYSYGCATCGSEVASEGRVGSYPATFDEWGTTASAWPAILDFNVSIACNLQCIQCNGEQSSAIRIHRERRPALVSTYDERFYSELPEFLRHARLARFAGGEPFLAPENFRIWELIAEVAPELTCTVITNGTIFNDRVEQVLDSVRMGFIFSIDGITAETYESIRVGADFDAMMANVERFHAHAVAAGTPASVNHCLMVQNHHEFADLLVWAEERRLPVDVSVVRDPARCSIVRLPQDRIAEVHRTLADRHGEMRGRLHLNLATWEREVARIGTWATCDPAVLGSLWGISGRMVLMFKAEGAGPSDDTEARRWVAEFADGGRVAMLVAGPDETVVDCSADLAEVLGVPPTEFVGRSVTQINEVLEREIGPITDYRVVAESADRVDVVLRLGEAEVRAAMVAMRDRGGWADRAHMILGLRRPARSA